MFATLSVYIYKNLEDEGLKACVGLCAQSLNVKLTWQNGSLQLKVAITTLSK